MAILSVFKSPTKQQQVVQLLDITNNTVTTSIIETWVVQTDSMNYEPIDLLGATDGTHTLPIVDSAYSLGVSSTTAVCKRVQPQRTKEVPTAFEVQIEYFLPMSPPDTVTLSIGTNAYTQTVYYDRNGNPTVNSSGQQFDPALAKTYYDAKFTVGWITNVAPPVDTIMNAAGLVNTDDIELDVGGWNPSFTARQLKLIDPVLNESTQGSETVWTVSFTALIRYDTWRDKVQDQGYYAIAGSDRINAVDGSGNQLNAPAPLDGSGNFQDPGDTPYFFTFQIEDQVAFASIFAAIP